MTLCFLPGKAASGTAVPAGHPLLLRPSFGVAVLRWHGAAMCCRVGGVPWSRLGGAVSEQPSLAELAKPTPSLYAKLAEVMAEVQYVQKRGWNDFHKYHYVTEADLVDAVREKLAARNVVLIPSAPTVVREGKLTTVFMTFTFCDGDSGETHEAEWAGTGEDAGDKGLYKAYTGAVKYFLMKAFLIPTGDDPEADTRTDERSAAPMAAPAAKRDTISDKDAGSLYSDAQDAGVPDDKLALAVAHVSQAQASKLGELTGPEALKLGAWIEGKRADKAPA